MLLRVEPAAHPERGMGRCRLSLHLIERLAAIQGQEFRPGQAVRVRFPGGRHTALCSAWPLPPAFGADEPVVQVDLLAVEHNLGPRHVCSEDCLPRELSSECVALVPPSEVGEAETIRVAFEAATLDGGADRTTLPDTRRLSLALSGALVQPGHAGSTTISSPFLGGLPCLTVLEAEALWHQQHILLRVTPRTEIQIVPVRSSASESIQSTAAPFLGSSGVAGLDDVHAALSSMVRYPLLFPEAFDHLGLECPKGVLLYGPPGTGKTQLVMTVAIECAATLVSVRGPDIFAPYLGESESNLRRVFGEATQIAQSGKACILFIDEIDALCPHRQDSQAHEARVVAQLLTLMDGLASRGRLVVIAATNRPNSLDPALRRPGRFDREISVGIPSKQQRLAILKLHSNAMPLRADVDLLSVADATLGYVGADLVALCREASMHALRVHRAALPADGGASANQLASPTPSVGAESFQQALRVVVPSTRREAELSIEATSWDDIGGLEEVKGHMRQAIEWPFLYADTFRRLGMTAPKGVLLYGPPGCSKTTLVRAAASSCRATFWSINGAQIYSPYVGDSEKAIRTLFKRARQTSPSVIFLDEVDALVGSRDQEPSGNGVSERVLSTVLNEMDGIESAGQVLVVAATNRPDMLDSAFLRPGRIDRIVYVPPPDLPARREILRVKTRRMPLASDVDFESLAVRTELYTGADLENLCREAALNALRENISAGLVSSQHFETALSSSTPSLTSQQIEFYAKLHVDRSRSK